MERINMTNIYYVRVSSATQNTDRQLDELKAYAANNNESWDERYLYVDHASGKDFDRPAYKAMKKALRDGDCLFITSLDRLGRNKDMILDEWRSITKELGADIVVTSMSLLDTRKGSDGLASSFVADLVLQVLTFIAEDERTRIKERQSQGIKAAKKRGKHLGRPKKDWTTLSKTEKEAFIAAYNEWKDGKQTAVKTFESLSLAKATFYRIVKQYEAQKADE